MNTHTHDIAPTQFVEANGIRFAFRRFGRTGGVPIIMAVHFRGTMDHWDQYPDLFVAHATLFLDA